LRILFLTQLPPLPLDAGAKTRAYYVLRYLAAAGHEVSVVCFLRPDDPRWGVELLKPVVRQVSTVPLQRKRKDDMWAGAVSQASEMPFLIPRDDKRDMWRELRAVAGSRRFDAVHADQLWMAQYALGCSAIPLKVLDQHNAVYVAARRMAAQVGNPLLRAVGSREAAKLELFERKTCAEFDRVVWVTDADRRAIAGAGTARNGHDRVIPIATDPHEQQPVKRASAFRVTFLGGMHWPPNADGIAWFAESIWPRVAGAVPEAVLTVVGKRPPKAVRRLPAGARVQVMGFVPSLENLLAETAVFIVPLRSGAGMRVKILDAWCWGLPVVSTTLGAEGLEAHSGLNLLLADDESAFADAVVEMFRDPGLSGRISQQGRITVQELYDWKKAYAAWDQIYQ
jgi:glycosyltransferase involved in cell wall biosynthesis